MVHFIATSPGVSAAERIHQYRGGEPEGCALVAKTVAPVPISEHNPDREFCPQFGSCRGAFSGEKTVCGLRLASNQRKITLTTTITISNQNHNGLVWDRDEGTHRVVERPKLYM